MNDDGTKEPNNLLISNGCVICLLDLKQIKDKLLWDPADHILPLPKVATLKLIENKLPVSVGLCKLGSNAYMIGGHEFPSNWKPSDLRCHDHCGGYNLYLSFLWEKSLKATSRSTYRLSLADDGTLTQCKSKFKKLKTPKLWPIVEKINDQIHVLDSVPFDMFTPHRDCIFSHEVLKRDGRSWSKIPTNGVPLKTFITSHVVLGNRMYAVDDQNLLVFDAEKKEWEVHDSLRLSEKDVFLAKQVWDILEYGFARCVGNSDPLYVLIAVVSSRYCEVCTHVVAYLVTSMGQVVCSQRVDDFFDGRVRPYRMKTGTVIKVDEEGKTMCTVVCANSFINGKEEDSKVRDYLFINTFNVEILSDAVAKIQLGGFCDEEFVRVVVKDRYVFKTDAHLKEEGGDLSNELIHFPCLQACFI